MAAQGSHQTEKRLCVGLLAHVDAGKTTLSEAMLYRAGVIRTFGRVDHGDTFLDTDAQERSRGITIFSKQAVLPLPGCTLPLLAKQIGFDPAVMASPFITTVVDAISLMIYFNFASLLLGI